MEAICEKCRKTVEYDVTEEPCETLMYDTKVTYNRKVARCKECGEEVWVGDLDDENAAICYDTYSFIKSKEYVVDKFADAINSIEISTELSKEDVYKLADNLVKMGFGRIVNFAEYVGGKIAGHSDYHGDSILCALYCAAEGKQISSVKPIDTSKYNYEHEVTDKDTDEHLLDITKRALSNAVRDRNFLAKNYYYFVVGEGQLTTEYYLQQAEKELAEGKKND